MADEAVADVAAQDSPASGRDQQQVDNTNLDDLDPALLDEVTGSGQGDEDDDELDELEFGFKKYQVPKSLKTAMADWQKATTTKEQTVSARAKALDDREGSIEERLKATDAELEDRAQLRQVAKVLEDYSKLSQEDWDAHSRANPMEADKHWRNFQLLKDEKAALEGKVGEAEKARNEVQSAELTKRVKAVTEFGAKNIPGFSQKQIDTLIGFAHEQGIDEATIKKNWSPQFYKLLHRAHLGETLLKKQAERAKASDSPTPEPLRVVKNKGGPKASLRKDMPAEEWVRVRNEQVAAKNRPRR